MLQGDKPTVARARQLRRTMTLPEVLLWQRLRQRPGGFKFRKQHPAKPYVLDFYCHEARLVIEVDGQSHGMGDRPEQDIARDAHFRAKGINTLRLPAREVLHDPDAAAEAVVALCTDARSTA
ncbi:endonuclease domain-containing protein [Novosphingobium sp. Gsoil 351]|uniref:endonuclease domain-containing protein n=1 Tax=Novosphingobium sp. Gsoil 351 TaxID=2675225 RepID=UPI0012B48BFE|nr:DUF559 domain-containing protein [Novosphingobium sp. Gsoil 351]QGN53526.1 DUF559 domain-containing protein [Novosphingobium sp. Gsoil 351]